MTEPSAPVARVWRSRLLDYLDGHAADMVADLARLVRVPSISGTPEENAIQDVLSELAIGIADGAERAQALDHVSDCADCRQELDRQSAVADELLLLAPGQEPPIGFELQVLRSIQPAPQPAE